MGKMTTGIIKFNLKKRMRQFNGQERTFNIPELVKAINSDKVQERVRLGDLNGFYGHWARIQFGAEPNEGGVVDGNFVALEPCCRTIYLKAYPNGDVEHEQEFFNTELGIKAYNRLKAKSGGFSSVITQKDGYQFHGFDYVNEPNYASNRNYVLDSTQKVASFTPEILVLDDLRLSKDAQQIMDYVDILAEENEKLTKQIALMTDSLESLTAERETLLEEVIHYQEQAEKAEKNSLQAVGKGENFATLDSVMRQANSFKFAEITPLEDVEKEQEREKQNQLAQKVLKRYGY